MRRCTSTCDWFLAGCAVAVAMGPGRFTSGRRRRALDLLPRVVARPHQWAGLDVPVPHRAPQPSQLGELVRRVVAGDREVLARRPEILPDGQDVDAPALRP